MSIEIILNQANMLLDEGKSAQAEALYRQVLDTAPFCAPAWYGLGWAAFKKGAFDTAVSFFEKAHRLAPGEEAYAFCLANALQEEGFFQEAISLYDSLPQIPESAVNKGIILSRQGKDDEAEAVFLSLLAQQTDFLPALLNLALLYRKKGKQEKALLLLTDACTKAGFLKREAGMAENCDCPDGSLYHSSCDFLCGENLPDDAWEYLFQLAVQCRLAGKAALAICLYEGGLLSSRLSTQADVWDEYGLALMDGARKEALEEKGRNRPFSSRQQADAEADGFSDGRSIHPIVSADLEGEAVPETETIVSKAGKQELGLNSPCLHAGKNEVAVRKNGGDCKNSFEEKEEGDGFDFPSRQTAQKALEAFKKAEELDSYLAKAASHQGDALAFLGKKYEAEAAYKRAVSISDKEIEAFHNLGVLLSGMQRYQEALEMYRRVILLEPDFLPTLLNLAVLVEKSGDDEEAAGLYLKILSLVKKEEKGINNGEIGKEGQSCGERTGKSWKGNKDGKRKEAGSLTPEGEVAVEQGIKGVLFGPKADKQEPGLNPPFLHAEKNEVSVRKNDGDWKNSFEEVDEEKDEKNGLFAVDALKQVPFYLAAVLARLAVKDGKRAFLYADTWAQNFPEDRVAQYTKKALSVQKIGRKGEEGSSLAAAYAESFYDAFASSYEAKMNELDCHVPEKLARLVQECEQSSAGQSAYGDCAAGQVSMEQPVVNQSVIEQSSIEPSSIGQSPVKSHITSVEQSSVESSSVGQSAYGDCAGGHSLIEQPSVRDSLAASVEKSSDRQSFIQYFAAGQVLAGPSFVFRKGLDLGCGTGAGAAAFLNRAADWTGVDISGNMLSLADKKGIYSRLVYRDILSFLKESKDTFGLIISTEGFCYMADLKEVFALTAERMEKGGLFAASLEKNEFNEEKRALLPSGRFVYNRAAVEEALKESGLETLCFKEDSLRREGEGYAKGFLFVARKL